MQYTTRPVGREELSEILSRHEMWLQNSDSGAKADLSNCFLRGKWFEQVDLRGANLQKVDFIGAKLRNVKFNGANLKGASFRYAELINVDFFRANLTNTQFGSELWRKVDLTGAIGVGE